MNRDDRQLEQLVERVIERLARDPAVQSLLGGGADVGRAVRDSLGSRGFTQAPAMRPSRGPEVFVRRHAEGRRGIFPDVDSAVQAARTAHERLVHETSMEVRIRAIEAVRRVTLEHLDELARMAVEETGLGRVDDKVNKNRCAATKTPGIEILRTEAYSGDHGLAIAERAPFGVIAALTPSTNCTETLVNNGIGMLAGGNAVVFGLHPSAKRVGTHLIRLFNEACTAVGAPDNLFCAVPEPTIEAAGELMRHPDTRIVVVTGGGGVVKAAMSTGKKVIAAGPGNPPVVVDETADLRRAARSIIAGASLDNNIVCIVEKEIVAVERIADDLIRELEAQGAYRLDDRQIAQLEELLIERDHPSKRFIGKNVSVILREIGVRVGDDVRIAFGEVDERHPFVQVEMLMPVIPLVRARDVEEAIDMAVRMERRCYHTAVMHSTHLDHLDRMARAVNTSLFVKNGPSFAGLGLGGEGYTSWTIAGPTGEGLTTAWHFTRPRRCTLVDHFRIV